MERSNDEVEWLNNETDHRNEIDHQEDEEDWTREYNVDQEIEMNESIWDSRLRRMNSCCRAIDSTIVLSLWGCSLYYYIVWFRTKHHPADGKHVHLVVLLATIVLGFLYGVRGSIDFLACQKVITFCLMTVQLGLCVYLMLLRSHYFHQKHGVFLFHALSSVSGIAVVSELIRLVLVIVMQRRKLLRAGLEAPLLEGVEWQLRQQEWASRTEEDPLWWSRDEKEDEESTISGRRSCP